VHRAGHVLPRPGGPPDGVFADWQWDGERLVARTDRYGFHPLFYFVREGELGLAPDIGTLLDLGAPRELDHAALAVFLRLGYFLADDTPFRAIRALPPAAEFHWMRGHLSVEGHYAIREAEPLPRRAALDRYVELVRQAVRRRPPPGPFVVPLSGGRDSRHLLLELIEAGYRPEFCLTTRVFPPRRNEDVETAARVAAAVGVPHVIVEQTETRFDAELRKNARLGFLSDEHAWFLAVAERLAGRVETSYDGIGGDMLTEGAVLKPDQAALADTRRFDTLADAMLLDTEALLASLLVPEVAQRMPRGLAVARMAGELGRHERAANPLASFLFWNRDRREIALSPFVLLRGVPRVYAPYVDHDLYDLMAAQSSKHVVAGSAFHTDAIALAFPRFAGLPYGRELPPAPDLAESRRFAAALARYAIRGGGSRAARPAWLVPRLLRSLVDRRYCSSVEWFGPMALYLMQLERAAAAPARAVA
jgi:hypothetical protein